MKNGELYEGDTLNTDLADAEDAAEALLGRRRAEIASTVSEAAALSAKPAHHRRSWRTIGAAGAPSAQPAHYRHSRIYATALSVMSSPRSMIANASRSSASVMHSGGFVKNVFQRTNV